MRKLPLLLILLLIAPLVANAVYTKELYPTDDAYIVADLLDPQDRLGLRSLNTGDFNFTKVWYAWNITGRGEFIVSYGMMKFDLSDIRAADVISAQLELTALNVQLSGASREVVLFKGLNNTWSEDSVTFNNHPGFNPNITVSTTVLPMAKTYTWDLTDWVKKSAGSQLTLYISFKTLYRGSEEQVVFFSKDFTKARPKLILELVGEPQQGMLLDPMLLAAIGVVAVLVVIAFLGYRYVRGRPAKPKKRKRAVKKGICPNCKKPVSEEFKLCPYCGYQLKK